MTQSQIARSVNELEERYDALIKKYDLRDVNYAPFLVGTARDLAAALSKIGVRP